MKQGDWTRGGRIRKGRDDLDPRSENLGVGE